MPVHPAPLHCLGNGTSDPSEDCAAARWPVSVLPRAEGGGVGEPGAWGEITAGLRVSRPVLVARLLELDAAGALTTAHVRAGAQVGGVNVRTVWRWLDAARGRGAAWSPGRGPGWSCPTRRGRCWPRRAGTWRRCTGI